MLPWVHTASLWQIVWITGDIICSWGLKFPVIKSKHPNYRSQHVMHKNTHSKADLFKRSIIQCNLSIQHSTTLSFYRRCRRGGLMANNTMRLTIYKDSSKVIVNSLTERLGLCTESTWRWRLSLHNAILRSLLKVHHLFVNEFWQRKLKKNPQCLLSMIFKIKHWLLI